MANAALTIDNLAIGGNITPSSQEIEMPASNLLTPHVSERWRSQAGVSSIILDKGGVASADVFALAGLTGTDALTVRLRLSAVDPSGIAAELGDFGPFADGSTNLDLEYGMFVHYAAAPIAWRYALVDFNDSGRDYNEGGLVFTGLKERFTYNFAPGGGITNVDRSRVQDSPGGLTLTWDDDVHRLCDLNFAWVTEAQRYGLLERLDRVNGRKKNVLLTLDSDSGNLARDSIIGLVTDTQPNAFTALGDIFARTLQIKERA